MIAKNKRYQWLLVIFFLFFVLFNYPVLAIFNNAKTADSLPKLLTYLFGVWALFIVGMLAFQKLIKPRR